MDTVREVSENLESGVRGRVARIIVWSLGGLLAALAVFVCCAVYYISLQDLSEHARPIETEISKAVGYPVSFEGPVHLTVLPHLQLDMAGLTIASAGETESGAETAPLLETGGVRAR